MESKEVSCRQWFGITLKRMSEKFKALNQSSKINHSVFFFYQYLNKFWWNCVPFTPFQVGRKHCVIIFYFQNSYKQNILVCLHINYGYTSILVQIGEPIAIFGTSAIPIEKKWVHFASPDAISLKTKRNNYMCPTIYAGNRHLQPPGRATLAWGHSC